MEEYSIIFKKKQNNVFGVDLGEEYVNYGLKHGLNLHKGNINYFLQNNMKADIIIYSDVLEHIPDINNEIKKIKKIMKKDSYLFIKLPSIKNLKHYGNDFLKQIQNAHVYYFTLDTLNNLMRKHNLNLISGNERIFALYTKNNKFTNLNNEYISIKNYLFYSEINKKITTKIKFYINNTLIKFLKKIKLFNITKKIVLNIRLVLKK
jgi:2-polyprenyl-3-methyl-5-hydroxy-6-metoxy-1,4-benzoquinol methylase